MGGRDCEGELEERCQGEVDSESILKISSLSSR